MMDLELMHDLLLVFQTFGLVAVAALAYLNGKHIREVHLSINSRMTELLEVTRAAAHAAGMKEEKDKDPIP